MIHKGRPVTVQGNWCPVPCLSYDVLILVEVICGLGGLLGVERLFPCLKRAPQVHRLPRRDGYIGEIGLRGTPRSSGQSDGTGAKTKLR